MVRKCDGIAIAKYFDWHSIFFWKVYSSLLVLEKSNNNLNNLGIGFNNFDSNNAVPSIYAYSV